MLEVDVWPELRDPVLVLALSGWVDAGMAGVHSSALLRELMTQRGIDLRRHRWNLR